MSIEAQMTQHPRRGGGRRPGPLRRIARGLFMYLLPPLVLAAGILGTVRLIETAPKAERRAPARQTTPVQVMRFEPSDVNAEVQVMGTVVPSQRITLQPRVTGEVVKLSPKLVPGGKFNAGEFILQIDPKDYELAVQRIKSQVAQAKYELKLEQGHQEIAEREWKLLDMQEQSSELDRELALRKPHLARTEALLHAAESALSQAELDLERTTLRAPFNCMVISENLDLGAQVTPQTQLATLVGTDEYWVQAAVPVDQLQWIRFPHGRAGETGSEAVIRQELGTGVQGEWHGQVVRLLGDLEPRGRMARVLISVPDPLRIDDDHGGTLPLLIDAYVNVEMQGKPVRQVIALPRAALREDNKVWVMNRVNELAIREVQVAWGNRENVLVSSGVEPGERVVVSDLAAPVAGTALRELDENPEAASQAADEN